LGELEKKERGKEEIKKSSLSGEEISQSGTNTDSHGKGVLAR